MDPIELLQGDRGPAVSIKDEVIVKEETIISDLEMTVDNPVSEDDLGTPSNSLVAQTHLPEVKDGRVTHDCGPAVSIKDKVIVKEETIISDLEMTVDNPVSEDDLGTPSNSLVAQTRLPEVKDGTVTHDGGPAVIIKDEPIIKEEPGMPNLVITIDNPMTVDDLDIPSCSSSSQSHLPEKDEDDPFFGKKAFACDICDFSTVYTSSLKLHMKTHTDEKPHACHICDYRTKHLGNLKTHIRIHTGEKPFACGICDYRTGNQSSRNTHTKTHSDMDETQLGTPGSTIPIIAKPPIASPNDLEVSEDQLWGEMLKGIDRMYIETDPELKRASYTDVTSVVIRIRDLRKQLPTTTSQLDVPQLAKEVGWHLRKQLAPALNVFSDPGVFPHMAAEIAQHLRKDGIGTEISRSRTTAPKSTPGRAKLPQTCLVCEQPKGNAPAMSPCCETCRGFLHRLRKQGRWGMNRPECTTPGHTATAEDATICPGCRAYRWTDLLNRLGPKRRRKATNEGMGLISQPRSPQAMLAPPPDGADTSAPWKAQLLHATPVLSCGLVTRSKEGERNGLDIPSTRNCTNGCDEEVEEEAGRGNIPLATEHIITDEVKNDPKYKQDSSCTNGCDEEVEEEAGRGNIPLATEHITDEDENDPEYKQGSSCTNECDEEVDDEACCTNTPSATDHITDEIKNDPEYEQGSSCTNGCDEEVEEEAGCTNRSMTSRFSKWAESAQAGVLAGEHITNEVKREPDYEPEDSSSSISDMVWYSENGSLDEDLSCGDPLSFQKLMSEEVEQNEVSAMSDVDFLVNCSLNSLSSQQLISEEVKRNEVRSVASSSSLTNTTKGVDENQKKKQWRRKVFCLFCQADVTNFWRHLLRNHKSEPEVASFAWRKPADPIRKTQLELLRKKGNLLLSSTGDIRPVREPLLPKTADDFTICTKCMGHFTSKSLYKHAKICKLRCDGESKRRKPAYYHQIAGQNLLLRNLEIDQNLRTQVFPKMIPDKVSLVAKSDGLITQFGARYLYTHRTRHFILTTSRKMRGLAKLLIAAQNLKPEIKSLFDLLQPHYFETIVAATKVVAKYDPKTNVYSSPLYAMNISTSLKECCDLAVLKVLKTKQVAGSVPADEATANLNTLKGLIQSNWKYEISVKAGSGLREKAWNKVTLVPLATDLVKLKNHLLQKGCVAETTLLADPSISASFFDLVETVYCRLLLLNRRRPGELQRLTVDIFSSSTKNPQENSYEEFSEVISPTERVLLQKFKIIVFRGKRGRGVPVLFSPDVFKHCSLIVEHRQKFVNDENRYLFARKSSNETIRGSQVLVKHVKRAGVTNPDAISCTKLTKHLATMCQLFTMTTTDVEQLASFTGHTIGVHKNVCRLADDVHQTAKIAKLLLLLEKGEAGKYKNKALDEIDITVDEEVDNYSEDENDLETPADNDDDIVTPDSNEHSTPDNVPTVDEDLVLRQTNSSAGGKPPEKESQQPKKKRNLVPWTSEQKKCAEKFFTKHISQHTPPKKMEVEKLISSTGTLYHNKPWAVIKVYIQNKYSKTPLIRHVRNLKHAGLRNIPD